MDDALDRRLERYGIYKKLSANRTKILLTVSLLNDAFRAYHDSPIEDAEVLERLIWNILRLDPFVISFLVENERFSTDEIRPGIYGGIVSKRLVSRIVEIAKKEGVIR